MRNNSQFEITRALPLTISAQGNTQFEELVNLANNQSDWLHEQLLHHGAILFRDFKADGASDLEELAKAFYGDRRLFDYSGGVSPRTHIRGSVYTSTEWTPILRIPLHNEMSYAEDYPSNLLFHCALPSWLGGATPIADSREIYRRIPKYIRSKFERLGIKYTRYYYRSDLRIECLNAVAKAHKTWMEVFGTSDENEVEHQCRKQNLSYEWQADGGITLTNVRPAVTTHPITHERVWFNQAHAFNHYSKNIGWASSLLASLVYPDEEKFMHRVRFGDGSPIPRADIYELLNIVSESTVRFRWKRGDVLLIDNILTSHGRDPYFGRRKVLTSLH